MQTQPHLVTFTITINFDAANQSPDTIARQLRGEIEDAIRHADLSGTNSDQTGRITGLDIVQHNELQV